MRYYILDVFTEQIFKGNPLAVVLDADGLSGESMQAIAREFNLSETTYVLRPTSPEAERRIRIFTPVLELPLAGHPVIGTWFLLASEKIVATSEGWNTFRQEVLAGILPIEIRVEEGRVREVWMTQATPQYFETIDPSRLLYAIGLTPDDTDAGTSLPAQFVSTAVKQLMLPVKGREALRRIKPNPGELSAILGQHDSHLFYAFTSHEPVYARALFCAGSLLFEDPATGSAAGALTAYLWKYRGRSSLSIHQGEEMGRGATIRSRISNDGGTVQVGGIAVIVAMGDIQGVETGGLKA